jgi:hypothetical protein
MGLHPLEQEVLKKWLSFRRLYTFLEREFQRINRICFKGRLPQALFHLNRLKFSRDVMSGGVVGATYKPPKSDSFAQMEFFPIVLLNRHDTLTALVHEMLHHWEWVQGDRSGQAMVPFEIHELTHSQFADPEKEYSWRLGHSAKYLAKAGEVAAILQLPVKELLFKDVRTLLL